MNRQEFRQVGGSTGPIYWSVPVIKNLNVAHEELLYVPYHMMSKHNNLPF